MYCLSLYFLRSQRSLREGICELKKMRQKNKVRQYIVNQTFRTEMKMIIKLNEFHNDITKDAK
jgi:hypothetical protein